MALTDGLVHLWSMDEASGATIADTVGDMTGEVINDAGDTVAVAPAGFGNHRNLTDSTPRRWIKLWNGTPDATYELLQWTITVRYRRNGNIAPADYGIPIYQAGSPSNNHSFLVYVMPDGTFAGMEVYSSTGAVLYPEYTPLTLHDGTWRRWTITGDGTTVSTYLDGALLGTVARDTRLRPKAPITIGEWAGTPYGQIEVDDAAIWSRALTSVEIASSEYLSGPITVPPTHIVDTLGAALSGDGTYPFTMSDSLQALFTDAHGYVNKVRDTLRVLDEGKTFWTQTVSLSEAVSALMRYRPAFVLTLADAAQAEDTTQFVFELGLIDRVLAADARATDMATSILDAALATDSLPAGALALVEELLSATDTWSFVDVLHLVDVLGIHSEGLTTVTGSIVLALLASDYAQRATTQLTTEEILADQAFQMHITRLATVLDEIQAALESTQTLTIMVSDTLEGQAGDAVEVLGKYFAEPQDVLNAWVLFRLGEEASTGWVMNTEGDMPLSEYVGYDFNSMCRVGDTYLGARDEGLYLLEGNTDDGEPIEAAVRTMMLDFGSPALKRVRNAYIGYTSDGKLLLKVGVADGGTLKEQWYEAQQLQADAPREQMIRVGRGLRSRYWQFELVNVDGSDFELTDLELHPVYLNRRV